jgi:hypothetical protein
MSKIVQAVNAMILHPEKITEVTDFADWGWLLFLYDGKHKWAMKETDGDYSLLYFKTECCVGELADSEVFGAEPSVSYSSGELGTKEARTSLRELYLLLKEKLLGIDKVLEDIIREDGPF